MSLRKYVLPSLADKHEAQRISNEQLREKISEIKKDTVKVATKKQQTDGK